MLRALLLALGATLLLAACAGDDSVDAPSGVAAQFRVTQARFVSGAFPAGTEAQPDDPSAPPRVNEIQSLNNTVRPGQRGKSLSGRASSTAMTVALGLEGDAGYWIVPVGATSIESPPDLDFSALADFTADLTPGPHRLLFAAADRDGRYGPRATLDITVAPSLPDGELVVALTWDRDVDLDLLVIQPDGNTLSVRGVRTPEGALVRIPNGPRVDLDSNAACAIDGVRQENAIYSDPQPGQYEVRVRMYAACGAPLANWHVRIARRGEILADVAGTSYASEVDAPGGGPTGTGRRAAQFAITE
jgi:hypothetical protein